MIGNICPKHVEVELQNKLGISSASSWFSLKGYQHAGSAQHKKLYGLVSIGQQLVRSLGDYEEENMFTKGPCLNI
jgi:hypothetical protein